MLKNILLGTAIIVSISTSNVMADTAKEMKSNAGANKQSVQEQKNNLPDDHATGDYLKNSNENAADNIVCKDDVNSKECRRTAKEQQLKKSLKVKEEPADGGMDLVD